MEPPGGNAFSGTDTCDECKKKKVHCAYCVESKKTLCRYCIGRLHIPGLPSANFTIEALDRHLPDLQSWMVVILNVFIVTTLVAALYRAGIDDDFFQGASCCPALGQGRRWLARFDANVFYYFKSSLSLYCDIEDSFWRLLMDGWFRNVVTASDSLLLLCATLPKALLFKSALFLFFSYVFTACYAVLATLLTTSVVSFEKMVLKVIPAPLFKVMNKAWTKRKFSTSLRAQLTEHLKLREKVLKNLARLLTALGWSAALRVAMMALGLHRIAAFGGSRVSPWQLLFEPVAYFFLAKRVPLLEKKLTGMLEMVGLAAKSSKGPGAPPLTLWRERPMTDVMEWCTYARGRFTRRYTFFQGQAQGMVNVLIDDMFNTVVLFRLVCIALGGTAGFTQAALSFVGFGGLLGRHKQWFQEATGVTDDSSAYLTDHLVFGALGALGRAQDFGVVFKTLYQINWQWPVFWHLLVPSFFFFLGLKWQNFLKQQQKAFKQEWEGKAWKDSGYMKFQEEHGSFWNVVDKGTWVPPVDPTKPPLPALPPAQ